ncbi:MAG TPA: winged helix-turn-helix domain-containing protein [Rhizomicrobium sp.]|jgi:Tol biopolymer transport system component/DNA-binding winged helix-turn-helix (wHTH) protein|nr:winged helix-turn-helix domain-containing protein [Rhizomicrobium sp.]
MSEKGEIDLAREADFLLGRLQVRPSLREIRLGGRAETLEPRVMQVLVLLAHADGAVVSRDQLIERCWGGRIVGEDAINRCIAKVRRVAELDGNESFAIETVTRVGYRLSHLKTATVESLTPPPEAPDAPQPRVVSAVPGVLPLAAAPPTRRVRSNWIWIAVIAVGLIAIPAAWVLLRPAQEWSIDRFQMLVSTPALEDQPALAPNGAMIAYAAGSGQNSRSLYLRNLTEGEAVRLTDDPRDEYSPAWSPQSDRIAFVRETPGKPCTIMVKPVPAGNEQEVAHCKTNESSRVAWGKDGALYFSDAPAANQTSRIVRFDLATGKRSDVTHPNPLIANDKEPQLSPDGKTLAFYRDQYPHSGIYLLDLASGNERRLTPDGLSVWGNGWTSDSSAVIVGTLQPDEPALWVYPLDGKPAKRLTFNQQEFGRIVGGPNNVAAVEVYTTRMSIVGADGRTLIERNSDILDPDMAADGSIVFVAYGTGGVSLVVKRPGKEPNKIASFKQVLNPHWSPDGSRIAFAMGDEKNSKIGVIRADGSARINVATMKADAQASAPVWSADGKSLLFSANDGHGWRLWRVAADGSAKPEALPGYGWYSAHFHGADIYATRFDKPGIWKLGDTPTQIIDNLSPDYWADWAIAGDTLAYVDFGDPKKTKIVLHPLNGGTDTIIDAPGIRQTVAGGVLALDPRSATPVYIRDLSDSDIALLHLAKR